MTGPARGRAGPVLGLEYAILGLEYDESPDRIGRGFRVVAGAGVEPATYRFSGDRSYQLSYPATVFHVKHQRS